MSLGHWLAVAPALRAQITCFLFLVLYFTGLKSDNHCVFMSGIVLFVCLLPYFTPMRKGSGRISILGRN
ncbi:uncharacterized protein BO96DRAFT_407363, partial [Aspergillus niger CBS 101883]|uniref:uncharacterized protein n=1 Tax=Aspergillus lacticoffeatus (strain CBS 101883) TaxID=1450533 RepID=UPI000D7F8D15